MPEHNIIMKRTAVTLAAAVTDAERETHYIIISPSLLLKLTTICKHAPR